MENDKAPSEMTVAELRADYLDFTYSSSKFNIWWQPIKVWFLARTWWKLKFEFEFHVSIPFWNVTRPLRQKFGIHHFSDDAQGDC